MSYEREYQSEPEAPSYVWEMLKRPLNVNLVLSVLAAASFLAIPFGIAGFGLPLLLLGASEAIAATFIPSSASFRVKIDREFALRRRERTAAHLCSELRQRVREDDPRWGIYARMCERIDSLHALASQRYSGLEQRDLLRLENGAVDFLGLWLAEQSMIDRQVAVDEQRVAARIDDIRERIESGAEDRRSLQKAMADLEELLLRHRRLSSRRAAVEAALLSLPDAFEEIYHAVMTSPSSDEGGARLQEAIDRLRLEEELESSYGEELRDMVPLASRRAGTAAARPAAQVTASSSAQAAAASQRPPPPPRAADTARRK